MSLLSRLIARMYHLPPAETYDIAVDKNLPVPMLDGVILRADHYYPRQQPHQPTLFIRTPYGRARLGTIWGQVFPERGFQVVIQSCRGTDDSGGEINPFRGEREDGLATIAWLKAQPWFDGRLGMAGPSYMGFTQWAVAHDAGPELKALSTQVTSSEFRSAMYPGGSLNLEIFLQWIQITQSLNGSMSQYLSDIFTASRRLKAATEHLPLCEADKILVGKAMPFWQDWLIHTEPGDTWWATEDFSLSVDEVTAPNHFVSGWYDFLLPQLLRDYGAMKQAGRKPYLTIGPWSHSSNGLAEAGVRESLLWLRAHLHDENHLLRTAPVRIYVMGANEWSDLTAWPPGQMKTQRWYLQPGAALSPDLPSLAPPSHYRYDPAHPTPNVGGATNATLGRGTGAQDNRQLEARPDVLVFTSQPLKHDTEIIGPVSAELFIQSNLEYTDFFVRLCDVQPDGKSLNVCDGLLRLVPNRPTAEGSSTIIADACCKIVIELWPTAYRFKQGHAIRLQVSSGAFPRYARNLGSGEPLTTGKKMLIAEQQLYHDLTHPSAIVLPVMEG